FSDATGANPTLTWAQLNSLGLQDGPNAYAVKVRVTDGVHSGVSYATALNLTNAPPTADFTAPTDGVRNQARTFTLLAIDPSPVDQAANFTFRVDWDGDGVVDQTVVGPSGMAVDHAFPVDGTFTVGVTAVDKDGGASATVSKPVTIVV